MGICCSKYANPKFLVMNMYECNFGNKRTDKLVWRQFEQNIYKVTYCCCRVKRPGSLILTQPFSQPIIKKTCIQHTDYKINTCYYLDEQISIGQIFKEILFYQSPINCIQLVGGRIYMMTRGNYVCLYNSIISCMLSICLLSYIPSSVREQHLPTLI